MEAQWLAELQRQDLLSLWVATTLNSSSSSAFSSPVTESSPSSPAGPSPIGGAAFSGVAVSPDQATAAAFTAPRSLSVYSAFQPPVLAGTTGSHPPTPSRVISDSSGGGGADVLVVPVAVPSPRLRPVSGSLGALSSLHQHHLPATSSGSSNSSIITSGGHGRGGGPGGSGVGGSGLGARILTGAGVGPLPPVATPASAQPPHSPAGAAVAPTSGPHSFSYPRPSGAVAADNKDAASSAAGARGRASSQASSSSGKSHGSGGEGGVVNTAVSALSGWVHEATPAWARRFHSVDRDRKLERGPAGNAGLPIAGRGEGGGDDDDEAAASLPWDPATTAVAVGAAVVGVVGAGYVAWRWYQRVKRGAGRGAK